jgi:hypothetical protein
MITPTTAPKALHIYLFLEAEYTYKLRKSFIPLRLQHRYVPDGWLGMLIGTRLYFDISNEDKIDQQMDNIMKELGTRGKIGIPGDDIDGMGNSNQTCFNTETELA